MPQPDKDHVIEQIDIASTTLFDLVRRQDQIKLDYRVKEQALKEDFEVENSKLEAEIQSLRRQLADMVKSNRSSLLVATKKSFATAYAKFYYRRPSSKLKITNKAGVIETARRLGIVRQICNFKWLITPDIDKLARYLEINGEYIEQFDEFIDWPSTEDSLSVKPNTSYLTTHDPRRLSDRAIKLTD